MHASIGKALGHYGTRKAGTYDHCVQAPHAATKLSRPLTASRI
jgi:hypothetical protein